MEGHYAIMGSEGELEIPVAIRESTGTVDGMRLSIQQDHARIIAEVTRKL